MSLKNLSTLAGQSSTRPADPKTATYRSAVTLAVLGAALGLRVVSLNHERLWTDEVFSVTYAVQPIVDLMVSVLRFDTHLPLYYLQLHFWGLVSSSTLWFYVNSLLWSWLAVVALWRCADTFVPPNCAFLAALLFAVMPVGVIWAHTLRMYGMIGCFGILACLFCHRFFTDSRFKKHGILLAAALLIIAYSNGAGFLIIGYTGVLGLFFIWQYRPDQARIWWWIGLNGVMALLAAPAAINTTLRSTSQLLLPTPELVAQTLAFLISGPASETAWGTGLALIVAALVVVAFVADPKLRGVIIGFIATPIGFAIIASYTIKPIWWERPLECVTPFVALAAARGISLLSRSIDIPTTRELKKLTVGAVTGILVLGLAAASISAANPGLKPANFAAAAAEIRSGLQQGDVVFIPEAEAFWGIAWYLIGANWGSPLEVQDPSSFSETWVAILARLGPAWRARLHLEPRTRTISYHGSPVIVGLTIPSAVADAERVWLVNKANNRHAEVAVPGFIARTSSDYHGLTVQLLERSPP